MKKRGLQKPDWEQLQQIPLGLEIDENEPGLTISPDEARLRSETARTTLEMMSGKKPEWYERYAELRAMGWNWRVACYIAWASSPRKGRMPETQDELAREVLGLNSDRQIWVWRRKNPAIDEVVGVMQAAPLFEHRADFLKAMIESGAKPDYKGFQDRKLAFTMLGDYAERMTIESERKHVGDLGEMSDEELLRLARALLPVANDDAGEDSDDD